MLKASLAIEANTFLGHPFIYMVEEQYKKAIRKKNLRIAFLNCFYQIVMQKILSQQMIQWLLGASSRAATGCYADSYAG